MRSNTKKNGVKKIRRLLGLSQEAFAQAIGIKPAAVSNYENGRRLPEKDTAWAIVDLATRHGHRTTLEDIYLRH